MIASPMLVVLGSACAVVRVGSGADLRCHRCGLRCLKNVPPVFVAAATCFRLRRARRRPRYCPRSLARLARGRALPFAHRFGDHFFRGHAREALFDREA